MKWLMTLLLLLAACAEDVETPPVDSVTMFGPISVEVLEAGDQAVRVDLHWTRQHISGPPVAMTDLTPVVLFNEKIRVKAVAVPERIPGDALTAGQQAEFRASVQVAKTDWLDGCWQARPWMPDVVGSGPIKCLNQRVSREG